ncbi:MAG: hypothetical protein ACI9DC_005546 [Gammaproteobacteria bacterium]|jgi:hypothetical protein
MLEYMLSNPLFVIGLGLFASGLVDIALLMLPAISRLLPTRLLRLGLPLVAAQVVVGAGLMVYSYAVPA